MINLDMIGRIRDNKVYLGGTGTGSNFESVLEEVKAVHALRLEASRSGYSASDHTVFVTRNIPVLFFFSGLHGDYHKPSDTWEKIDAASAARLIDLVADLAGRLRTAERPQFVRVTPETAGHGYRPPLWAAPAGGTDPTLARFRTSARWKTGSGSPTSGPAHPRIKRG